MKIKEIPLTISGIQDIDIYKNRTEDYQLLLLLAQWIHIDQSNSLWADNILERFGSFASFLSAPVQELENALKLSDKELAELKLFHNIALRLLKSRIDEHNVLNHKKSLINYLIARMSRESIEHFGLFILDHNNRIIEEIFQSNGTVNTTSIYLREITRKVLQLNGSAIIMVHNHPAGNPQPSDADKKMTYKMLKSMELFNILVIDHLIIGNGKYFSFYEEGLLGY